MMELLSLHLKSEGVYISRMLSYENCEFATIEDAVSQEHLDLYDAAAVLWQQIFEDLVEAYRCGRLDFSEHPHTEEKANRKGAGMYMLQLIFHISHHNLLRLDSCVLYIT